MTIKRQKVKIITLLEISSIYFFVYNIFIYFLSFQNNECCCLSFLPLLDG